jgi:hypothetical protein
VSSRISSSLRQIRIGQQYLCVKVHRGDRVLEVVHDERAQSFLLELKPHQVVALASY